MEQTLPASNISIAIDIDHRGAGWTRQQALNMVQTDYVAFLDDDDLLYPNHLEVLHKLIVVNHADFAYSWFDGNDPLQSIPEFAAKRGKLMDHHNPHHTTMTVLVKTNLAKSVGFKNDHPNGWLLPQEDWRFILGCVEAGAKFACTSTATWYYNNHGSNTSGMGKNW